MATNNPTNQPNNNPASNGGSSAHPDDMLEAFAFDALDLSEEEQVQDHWKGCAQRTAAVEQYQETAAVLVGLVNPQEPLASL